MTAPYDAPTSALTSDRPWRLRAEHLDQAFGLTVRTPRLSWRLPDGAHQQLGYQLRVSGPDAAAGTAGSAGAIDDDAAGPWVTTDAHVLVAWPATPLAARERRTCAVRVRTDLGESAWSDPIEVEAGLDVADWTASWVAPVEDPRPEAGRRPGYLVRGRIDLPADVSSARAYVTAHGIYELFVNGTRVGDAELTPGYTSYRANLAYQTYDLTDVLVAGANTVGVLLTDGWYRGRVGYYRQPDAFGPDVAALVQVEVESSDGRSAYGSGADWEFATGSIVAADLMDGEAIDLGKGRPGWSTNTDGAQGWSPVRLPDGPEYDLSRLTTSPAPPVRVVEELAPVDVNVLTPTRTVVDFGQNINGWVRLSDTGGRSLALTHGEARSADGDVTVAHLASHAHRAEGAPPPEPALLPVGQYDTVSGSGPGDLGLTDGEVAFRHTTHGFQYLRLDGDTDGFDADAIRAEVVHTDLVRTGWFACSDDRLNKLHDAAVWSFRGNACDIPTDCPHRERAGWTGDWQLYLPTAAFLYDIAGFSLKWLRDLMADQRDDGVILNFAPEPNAAPGGADVLPAPWDHMQGSSGWAEAIVIVPWELYRAYGDKGVLAETYPAMQRWLDYCIDKAATRRHDALAARRPEAAEHEQYLWDTGYHWGEWLEPDDSGHDAFGEEGIVATAYFYRAADLMATIARVLGRTGDHDRYRELAANIRHAWQAEYVGADGRLARDTQATYARALAFGLLPADQRATAAARLAELVRANDDHLSTGFLSTPMLLPQLADAGYWDVAFDLLYQDDEPSWLVMTDRGATTIWESWDGLNEAGEPKNSLNHYSKGAVISFLHTHVVGLRAASDRPGYERFVVRPHVAGPLTWARATLDTPHGRIEAGWQRGEDSVDVTVTVPPGTSGVVWLPDGSEHDVEVGVHTFTGPLTPAG
jgi:alpha-L-rhamnosidase